MADKPALKKDWVLTGAGLEKLLAALDSAGVDYLEMRNRLEKFFAYNRVADPDDLIDRTLDRAARRLDEGEEVRNPVAYITGIARFVLREHWSAPSVDQVEEGDQLPDVLIDHKADDEEYKQTLEVKLDCLESCTNGLTPVERQRVIEYYHEEKRAKIVRHQQMAEELGITIINLRVRMFRTRARLERCMLDCLERKREEAK